MRLTSPSTTSKAAVTWGVAHTLWSTGKAIGAALLGSDVESNTVDKTGEDAHHDGPGAAASTLVTTSTTSTTSIPDCPPPFPRTQDLATTGSPMPLDAVGRSRDRTQVPGNGAQTCGVHEFHLVPEQVEAQEVLFNRSTPYDLLADAV
jgi:hypothetical protein